ncbi:coiled-coil domain-containing protein 74A isoform X1 [Astyanax mexicanus]|uniref:coiled-coil domain-containing protein 74A isoform X1 n=1 Tax=Astyanax mexicanus TaxID=7994 RepID=UPI0020CB0077|nr:coiled-coil domain-containing protein 74A isoform X1 [Astyanax mexicanus]
MDALVGSLERKVDFLQQQHKETLRELHSEIERLTRQNKELQFKLIMEPLHSGRKGLSYKGHKNGRESTTFKTQKGIYLDEKLKDTHLPPNTNLSCQTLQGEASETLSAASGGTELISGATGALITSLHPLRIHCNPSQPPRAPTLQECEVLIRQLYNANSLQSQEILRIKAVLREIVLNRKISPENYLLTKAYLADEKSRVEEPERFPQLPFPGLTRGLPLCQAKTAERMTLPALKQTLSTSFAERQRRSRALQRNRLRRTVT